MRPNDTARASKQQSQECGICSSLKLRCGAVFVVGFVLGFFWAPVEVQRCFVGDNQKERVVTARVDGTPTRRSDGAVAATVRTVEGGPCGLLVHFPDTPWEAAARVSNGDVLQFLFRPITTKNRITTAPFSYSAYLERRGIAETGYGRYVEVISDKTEEPSQRSQFIKSLISRFGESDALIVVLASTLGDAKLLSRELKLLFRETGTIHLIVVSGFHIAVIFSFIDKLLFTLLVRLSTIPHYFPARRVSVFAALPPTVAYTFIAGGEPPAVRALIALFVFVVTYAFGRSSHPFRTLAFAFLAVNILWPGYFLEASCQLTFAALLGLLVSAEVVRAKGREDQSGSFANRVKHGIADHVIFTAFTTFFTLPVVIGWFGMVAPLSAVINVILIPIFSVVVILGGGISLIAVWLALPFSEELLSLALTGCDYVIAALWIARDTAADLNLGVAQLTEVERLWICLPIALAVSALTVLICFPKQLAS